MQKHIIRSNVADRMFDVNLETYWESPIRVVIGHALPKDICID